MLTHSPLEQGYGDYSFLDQAVEVFEHGLDSILIVSIETAELDESFDEVDTMLSSVSSGFLCLRSTISYNCNHSMLLASNLIHYGTMLGHYFCLYHGQV